MAYIQGESRSQTSLFPVSLEELIPEDHLVRVIDLYVAKLDLVQLGFDKALPKSTGRPSYDPADQLKLYLYGYFQRIRSSRRLEAECQRNIEVMWLINRLGNLKQWVFGNARFLLRQLEGARAEMALAVNAYNLKRAISVLGGRQLMALMG
jgi:transposase